MSIVCVSYKKSALALEAYECECEYNGVHCWARMRAAGDGANLQFSKFVNTVLVPEQLVSPAPAKQFTISSGEVMPSGIGTVLHM